MNLEGLPLADRSVTPSYDGIDGRVETPVVRNPDLSLELEPLGAGKRSEGRTGGGSETLWQTVNALPGNAVVKKGENSK